MPRFINQPVTRIIDVNITENTVKVSNNSLFYLSGGF